MARSRASSSPVEPPPAVADPVTESLRDFLGFFEREFADVAFPQHEGEEISAANLHALAERFRESSRLEAEAEAALARAREQLAADHRALQGSAKQAHAYARVFAADRPELLEGLTAFRLNERKLAPRKNRKAPKKRAKKGVEVAETSQLKLADDESSAA